MSKKLEGKVVVITGASAGLGRAIARLFAKEGANLALIARGKDGLEAAVKEAEDEGVRAVAIPIDVSDSKAMEAAADYVEETLGPIDIWINNAMVSVFGPLKKMEAMDFDRVTQVTYHGQVYGTMAALKKMMRRDKGKIILIGSALAYRGIPLQSAYCGAKHAIHGFFESLRAELIHDRSHIQLSMVQMPAMNTTQFGFVKSYLPNKPKPMGIIYEPEAAARSVLYAALENEREIFYGVSTYKTVLGNKVLPGWLDKYLAENCYDGQQTDERDTPGRINNLYAPIPGDHGARGPFDKTAKSFSPIFQVKKHPLFAIALAGAATFGLYKLFQSNSCDED